MTRTLLLTAALLTAATLALNGGSAQAIANGGAINWTAAPAAFVTSLYTGVLVRAPESGAVVAGWASSVTGDPRSRLNVFNGFIGSPEYRGRYPNGTRGTYHLWVNNCPKSPNNRFAVASTPPAGSWSAQINSVSYGYGIAMMGYYQAFTPYRRC